MKTETLKHRIIFWVGIIWLYLTFRFFKAETALDYKIKKKWHAEMALEMGRKAIKYKTPESKT